MTPTLLVKDRKKLFLSLSVVLVLLLPAIWFGLGHVIAKQALTALMAAVFGSSTNKSDCR